MNKGMILELKGEEATVLTPEGEFRSITKRKQQRWQIGEEVDLPPVRGSVPQLKRKKRVFIPSIALAASLLLVFVSIFAFLPFGGDQTAIAYVSVDINPSVEIGINKSLEVIDLVGLNQDGQQLVSIMEDWSRKPLDQVTMEMITIARKQGFLTENQDVLVSTSFIDEESESRYVSSVDLALEEVEKKAEQESEVQQASEVSKNQAGESKKKTKIQIHQFKTKTEIRNQAKEKGISPGKYSIYLEAVEQGVEIDLEEVTSSSISQLAQKLNGLGSILSNKPSKKDDENEKKGEDGENTSDKNNKTNEENGKDNGRENGPNLGRDKDDDGEDEDKKRIGKPDHSDKGNKDNKGPADKDRGNNNGKNEQEESEDHIELDLELHHPRIPGILDQVPGLVHDDKGDKQRGKRYSEEENNHKGNNGKAKGRNIDGDDDADDEKEDKED